MYTESPTPALTNVIEHNIGGLKFVLLENCEDSALTLLSDVIRETRKKSKTKRDGLSGRGLIRFIDLPNMGCIAIKQYRRGGLISKVVRERYLSQAKLRPEQELEILVEAQKLGVNVPRPLGFVTEGGLFYKAWLLTQEIPKHRTLTEIAETKPYLVNELIGKLVTQVSRLISARIHHVDLHPGNTVVSGDNEVYILDFDKAKKVSCEPKELRDRYLVRWRRAVIKHDLPEVLSESFCLGLRRSAIIDS
jgi:3-deoxy-D-manno-octulosonic acid kinase